MLNATLADLKTGADFERENPPGKTPTESANPRPETPGGPDTKLIFQNATGASATTEVIDVPYRAELNDLAQRIGGEDKVADFERRYDEANALFDLDSELDDRPLTPIARNQAALKLIAEFDAILASPTLAQQELDDFFARDINTDPVAKRYWTGDRNDPIRDAIWKLQQAAKGLPIVARPKDRGDGWIK